MANFWQNIKTIIRGFSSILGSFSKCKISIPLNCTVDSEWNDVFNFVVLCSIAELFVDREITKCSLQSTTSHTKFLYNRTYYNKTVCTVVFSSRWPVYWYKFFSVLSTLQKWENLTKRQVDNKGISPISGGFSKYEIFLSLQCTRKRNCVVSLLAVTSFMWYSL